MAGVPSCSGASCTDSTDLVRVLVQYDSGFGVLISQGYLGLAASLMNDCSFSPDACCSRFAMPGSHRLCFSVFCVGGLGFRV